MFNYNEKNIKIVEVGPRDGLQNEKAIISLEDKLRYIDLLYQSGVKTIEATSFVRAPKIPQMADAFELMESLNKKEYQGASFPCLVPNLKGLENAMSVGVKEISLFSATSDEFTKKNINCTVDESFDRMIEVVKIAERENIKIRGYVSTAFGCPYAGDIGVEKLEHVIKRFFDIGAYEVSIGDTIGVATPKQVYEYLNRLQQGIELKKLAMHFHDTRGMALANIISSLECDITTFDSSSGGLGGCPYANGATGNIATEELVYLFSSLGLETGVDLEKLKLASHFILEKVQKVSSSKLFQTFN